MRKQNRISSITGGFRLAILISVLGAEFSESWLGRVSAQDFFWNSPTNSTFTVGPWMPLAPTFLPGEDETLHFGSFLNAPTPGYTATNNTASFTRVINFNSSYGSSTITIATSSSLTLNGVGNLGAQINQNGFGDASLGSFTMGSDLLIGGSGTGNLTFTGGINNPDGHVLTINQTGGGFSHTGSVVRFSSSFSGIWAANGSTVINGGNVRLFANGLGPQSSNVVTFNSGSLSFEGSGVLANNFVLNNTLNVVARNGAGVKSLSGVLSGTGGLNVDYLSTGSLSLTGANTFTGDVSVRGLGGLAGIQLSEANGSLANVSQITLSTDSRLLLFNSIAPAMPRLNAAATVNLHSAQIVHEGNSSVATTTAFGALNSTGQATLTVNPGVGTGSGGGSMLSIGT
jgi:hypothetical protein